MLPLLALADELASDLRLTAPMTFEERYLPIGDFTKRTSSATKASILADTPMVERKLALYVDRRPVAETMARVADALGARWIREASAWRLEVDPEVAREEAAAEADDVRARRTALGRWAASFSMRRSEADAAMRAFLRREGASKAASALWEGRTLVATPDGRAGTVQLGLPDHRPDPEDIENLPPFDLFLIRYDPFSNRVRFQLRGYEKDRGIRVPGEGEPKPDSAPTAIARRVDAWAREADPTPLRSASPLAPSPPSGLTTLSDALARLHARSGRAFVAETFRLPLGSAQDPSGATVGTVLDRLRKAVPNEPFAWRAEGGWTSVRFRDAWRLRPGEIPERLLVPLERHEPTVDDYARLAGAMTPPQRAALAGRRPVVAFRLVPLRQAYWGLYTIDALPRSRWPEAQGGVPYDALPPLAQVRWNEAVGNLAFEAFVPTRWLDALLGGAPRPANAGLIAGAGSQISAPTEPRSPDGRRREWPTWVLRFTDGRGEGPSIHLPLGAGVPERRTGG